MGSVHQGAAVLNGNGLDRVLGDEGALLEGEEVLVVGGASLWVHDQGRHQPRLRDFLPLRNVFQLQKY